MPTGPSDDANIEVDVDVGDLFEIASEVEEEEAMPEKTTKQRLTQSRRRGNRAITQAGAFVEEEMRHRRSEKHGRMSRKQAIAIGLSKAREAGVKVPRAKRSRS
jgi:hypothetical protein